MSTSISDIRTYDPSATPVAKTSDPNSTQEMAQNFLKMLTVQLQNQDPMNPMDNAAMTTQLAQLNTMDGINRLNTSITSLLGQMQAANFMGLSSSVGKMALAAGNSAYYMGQPMSMAVKLDNAASSIKATILNAAGETVDTVDLGAASVGVTDFIWDGTDSVGQAVATGPYRVEIDAKDAQGQPVGVSTYVAAQVATVGMDGTDMQAGLSDGRKVKTSDILKWVLV